MGERKALDVVAHFLASLSHTGHSGFEGLTAALLYLSFIAVDIFLRMALEIVGLLPHIRFGYHKIRRLNLSQEAPAPAPSLSGFSISPYHWLIFPALPLL